MTKMVFNRNTLHLGLGEMVILQSQDEIEFLAMVFDNKKWNDPLLT